MQEATLKQLNFIEVLSGKRPENKLTIKEASIMIAKLLKESKKQKKEAKAKPQKVNQYGIQVGDVFVSSWGYDATYHDFYEVVEVMGKEKVKVKQISKGAGTTPSYSCCEWTVRPNKSTYANDEAIIRTVKNDRVDGGKQGCWIRGEYSFEYARYVEDPFSRDWEEDDYH